MSCVLMFISSDLEKELNTYWPDILDKYTPSSPKPKEDIEDTYRKNKELILHILDMFIKKREVKK